MQSMQMPTAAVIGEVLEDTNSNHLNDTDLIILCHSKQSTSLSY